MPLRKSSVKACELASRSPNETGRFALIENFSDMTHRLTQLPQRRDRRLVYEWVSIRRVAHPSRRQRGKPFSMVAKAGKRQPAPPICIKSGQANEKRAAVAGGSKVITGRRQTEWTGAT